MYDTMKVFEGATYLIWAHAAHLLSETYQGFLDSCAESGPKGCALASTNSSRSSGDIDARINKLRFDLRARPIPVPASKVRTWISQRSRPLTSSL